MSSGGQTTTTLDFERCYRALESRDARFDGQFVVTVSSTGIYRRPSCPARTPKRANVALSPPPPPRRNGKGFARVGDASPTPCPVPSLGPCRRRRRACDAPIADGVVDRPASPGWQPCWATSPRQLERIHRRVRRRSASHWRAQRAANAWVLITRTDLAMTDIAYAAGFASVRQFNDTIRSVFDALPVAIASDNCDPRPPDGHVSLRLPFRARR